MESYNQFAPLRNAGNAEFTNVASVISLINRNNGKLLDSSTKDVKYSTSIFNDLPPPEDGMHSRVEFMRLLHEKKSGRVDGTTTDKIYSKLPDDLPPPEDGKQSRVEFIRSIHERKAGRYSDTSNESKPVIPKVDDLPPSEHSRVESMRLIYEKKNEDVLPASPSHASVSSRRVSLSNAVERPYQKYNKRISYPVGFQNSVLPTHAHQYNPLEYEKHSQVQKRQQQQQQQQQHNHHHNNHNPNHDQELPQDHDHQQQHRNVTLRIKHYEKGGRAPKQLNNDSDSYRENTSYKDEIGFGSCDDERSDLEEIADIVARGYDIQTATQIQKLGMKKSANQRRASTSNVPRKPSHQNVQAAPAMMDERKSDRTAEKHRLSFQPNGTKSASPTDSMEGLNLSQRNLSNSFLSHTQSIKKSPRKVSDVLANPASAKRYSPSEENNNTTMKPIRSRPSSRADNEKVQDRYEDVKSPMSASKADTMQSPYSQGQQSSSQHTTVESSAYSLQYFLDIGFSVTDATRLYQSRRSRHYGTTSKRDKAPPPPPPVADDRELSLSFQDLPSVSGLSSPSLKQPTTPIHIRRKMISHANFMKKDVTPDPVQCGDSEEDYGELGPFSISTGEPGINLKLEDISFNDNSSSGFENMKEGQSSCAFDGENNYIRFGSNEFPPPVLRATLSMQSITSSITLESFPSVPTDDDATEVQSHKVMEDDTCADEGEDNIVTNVNGVTKTESTRNFHSGIVPEFTIYDELEIRRIMSENGCTLTEATELYYHRRQQRSTQSSIHSSIQDSIKEMLSEQEALFGFNMYDMILPGDHSEITTIRGRLNCDLDTAILTIFERRNRLINNYTYGVSRDGVGQYSSALSQITGKPKNKCGYDHEGYEVVAPPHAPAVLVPARHAPPNALRNQQQPRDLDRRNCSTAEGVTDNTISGDSVSSIPTGRSNLLVPSSNSSGIALPSSEAHSVEVPRDDSLTLSPIGASTCSLSSPGESGSAISGTESGVTSNESDRLTTAEDPNIINNNNNNNNSQSHRNNRTLSGRNSISNVFSLKKLFAFRRSASTTNTSGSTVPPDTHAPLATTTFAATINPYEEVAVRRLYGFHVKDVRRLVKMGFSKDQAVQALIQCDNDVEHAANVLAGSV